VPEAPSLPEELRDRYQVDGELGRGGFGVVLRARDRELERAVAIKLLADQGRAELRERFDREAALLAALEHPGVVRLYDFGHTPRGPYLVMELLEGRTLEVDPAPDLLAVAREVGAALAAIHAAGVIHRDVKPANILRTRDGRTVLLDLGLARDLQRETMTRTGQVLGTPAYLAPELWAGQPPSPAADWFALGVSLFQKLEGRLPWTAAQVLRLAQGGALPAPRFSAPEPSPGLRRLIASLLEPDPTHRLAGVELPGPGPSRGSSNRPAPDSRARLALGAVALALGVALGVHHQTQPLPPVPRAPPPDPAEERRRSLDEALEALASSHREEDGTLSFARRGGAPGEHLMQVLDERLAPGYPKRLDRVYDTLVAYLSATPAEVADRHLEEVVLPTLLHFAQDDTMLSWYRPIPWAFGNAEAAALHRDRETRDQVVARIEELEDLRRDAVRRLARWDHREAVLRAVATLHWGVPRAVEHAYFQEALEDFDRATDLSRRARIAVALVLLAPAASDHMGSFRCVDRRRLGLALEDCARDLSTAPEAASPQDRAWIAAAAAGRQYLDMVTCPDQVEPKDYEELAARIQLADEAGHAAPAPVAMELETIAMYDRTAGVLLPDLGPRLVELVERIQEVALRHEARLRRSPREVGLGTPHAPGTSDLLGGLRPFGSLSGS
jgi:hypothetical protein